MALLPGSRLTHYEIIELIGAGGMGEVYRAIDRRLDRLVALKIVAGLGSAEARARFEREARLIASLEHPHICGLHDIGREGEIDFLVMPLLDGETLAERLRRGPLGVDEAIQIARQIADALDRVHRRGITHRDLKPGNVMLTPTGPRLLDFGLASQNVLAFDADLTALPLTTAGAVIGTLPYMAPEQVGGGDIDWRADIWALGCLIHEMLTGQRPFTADGQEAVMAAILAGTPRPPSAIVDTVPPGIDTVVAGALEKNRELRWQSARDLAKALALARDASGNSKAATSRTATRGPLTALAAGAAVIAVGLVATTFRATNSGPQTVVRFEIGPPSRADVPLGTDVSPYLAVSPDGSSVAFIASVDGRRELWIRKIGEPEARKLPGTTGARAPFWSPDSKNVGFFAAGKIMRMSLPQGLPEEIGPADPNGNSATWGKSGVILFAEWGQRQLMRVADKGGTPEVARTGDGPFGWPQFLPDGRHYIYTVQDPSASFAQGFVGTLDSDETTIVPGLRSRADFVDGHLVFWRDGALVAQRFDLERLALAGEPAILAKEVTAFALTGFAAFSASPGLLAYQSGIDSSRLTWTSRDGTGLQAIGPTVDYTSVDLSSDDSKVAFAASDPVLGTADIFVHDLARDLTSRVTTDPRAEIAPVWAPDGRTIIYSAYRRGPPHLVSRSSTGAGEELELTGPVTNTQRAGSVSADGLSVVFSQPRPGTGYDILRLRLQGPAAPEPLVAGPAAETFARLSPDGHWLAFVSNESGQDEVYVQPVRSPSGRRQVSRAGGANPRWRRDARELFYLSGTDRREVFSVDLSATGSGLELGSPRLLFGRDRRIADFDVAADGKRLLVVEPSPGEGRTAFKTIVNWTQLLSP